MQPSRSLINSSNNNGEWSVINLCPLTTSNSGSDDDEVEPSAANDSYDSDSDVEDNDSNSTFYAGRNQISNANQVILIDSLNDDIYLFVKRLNKNQKLYIKCFFDIEKKQYYPITTSSYQHQQNHSQSTSRDVDQSNFVIVSQLPKQNGLEHISNSNNAGKRSTDNGLTSFIGNSNLASIPEHPNILHPAFCLLDDQSAYIGFPKKYTTSLTDYVVASDHISEEFALAVLLGLTSGLQQIHRNGFAHMQINSNSIKLNTKSMHKIVPLIDCFDYSQPLGKNGEVIPLRTNDSWNLLFMSPESYAASLINPKANATVSGEASDVWSLGVVLLFTLLGARICMNAPTMNDPQFRGIFSTDNGLLEFLRVLGLNPSGFTANILNKMLRVNPKQRISLDTLYKVTSQVLQNR